MTIPPYIPQLIDLDKVLHFMASRKAVPFLTDGQITEHLNKDNVLQVEAQYVTKVLNKFIRDGFVDYEDRHYGKDQVMVPYTARLYWITWDGIYFLQTGGYQNDISEKNKTHSLEDALKKLQIRTYWLTVAIMAGTGVAAVYYLFEILKDFGLVLRHP